MTGEDQMFIQGAYSTSAQEWLALAREYEDAFGPNPVSYRCREHAVDCLAKSVGIDRIWRGSATEGEQPSDYPSDSESDGPDETP